MAKVFYFSPANKLQEQKDFTSILNRFKKAMNNVIIFENDVLDENVESINLGDSIRIRLAIDSRMFGTKMSSPNGEHITDVIIKLIVENELSDYDVRYIAHQIISRDQHILLNAGRKEIRSNNANAFL
jgi:hypothetical protein